MDHSRRKARQPTPPSRGIQHIRSDSATHNTANFPSSSNGIFSTVPEASFSNMMMPDPTRDMINRLRSIKEPADHNPRPSTQQRDTRSYQQPNRPQSANVGTIRTRFTMMNDTEVKRPGTVNITAVTNLKTDLFHAQLYNVKKQDEKLRKKMSQLQGCWDAALNNKALRYPGKKLIDQLLIQNGISASIQPTKISARAYRTDPDSIRGARSTCRPIQSLLIKSLNIQNHTEDSRVPTFARASNTDRDFNKTSLSANRNRPATSAAAIWDSMKRTYLNDEPCERSDRYQENMSSDLWKLTHVNHHTEKEISPRRDGSPLCMLEAEPHGHESVYNSLKQSQCLDGSMLEPFYLSHDDVQGVRIISTQHSPERLKILNQILKQPAIHNRPASAKKRVKTTSLSKVLSNLKANRDGSPPMGHHVQMKGTRLSLTSNLNQPIVRADYEKQVFSQRQYRASSAIGTRRVDSNFEHLASTMTVQRIERQEKRKEDYERMLLETPEKKSENSQINPQEVSRIPQEAAQSAVDPSANSSPETSPLKPAKEDLFHRSASLKAPVMERGSTKEAINTWAIKKRRSLDFTKAKNSRVLV